MKKIALFLLTIAAILLLCFSPVQGEELINKQQLIYSTTIRGYVVKFYGDERPIGVHEITKEINESTIEAAKELTKITNDEYEKMIKQGKVKSGKINKIEIIFN